MAQIVLPNVPPELRDVGLGGVLSNNKLLTCIDMLKDMFRVSGTPVGTPAIANIILKSFGVNAQIPVAQVIDALTVNKTQWESVYKKKLTDLIELNYAKDRGTFTTHRFFYKKNVALTTESRLPDICRFVVDVGYDPQVINPGVKSLVGHGSTIDNGPRAHFQRNAAGDVISDGSLEFFPPQTQVLEMLPIYQVAGMDHICVTNCTIQFDLAGFSHTIITADIANQNVVITIVRDATKSVASNFVSATYALNGADPINWVFDQEGDICAANDAKNTRANEHTPLVIQDFIRFLLKFLGDEALCITTFIANHHFFNTTSEGRVAIMTGDGMVRLRCLLMNIPFVRQFDGSAQTLEKAPDTQKEKIKTCEFEYWCPEGNPNIIYTTLIQRAYQKVKSHNDGIKQLILSAITAQAIGITTRDIVPFREGNTITCYLNSLVETISHIQKLSDKVYEFSKLLAGGGGGAIHAEYQRVYAIQGQAAVLAGATQEQAVAAAAAAAAAAVATAAPGANPVEIEELCNRILHIDIERFLSIFTEIITFSADPNRNMRGSEIEAFFNAFKVNSFIERKNKQIVALKVSNLLESSKYISQAIPLTPSLKKPFVDFVYGLIKGTITYPPQGQGGGGNIQRGGVKFTCTLPSTTVMETYKPLHLVLRLRGGNIDMKSGDLDSKGVELMKSKEVTDEAKSGMVLNVPSHEVNEMTYIYDLHEMYVEQYKNHYIGSKTELEHICKTRHVSLFEIGHFWLRTLIDLFFEKKMRDQMTSVGIMLINHPFLKIEYDGNLLTVQDIIKIDPALDIERLLVTFLSCYYYEYLEKAVPISQRNNSLRLLDDLYWGIDEVISLNGVTLVEHMDSWLMFLVKTQTIPEYEVPKAERSKIFYIIRNSIVNDETTDIRTNQRILSGGKIYYVVGETYFDQSFTPHKLIPVTMNGTQLYRVDQSLLDSNGNLVGTIYFNEHGNEVFYATDGLTYPFPTSGGSKRKVKSNKRSNKRSNMNRKTRKNRFSLLGKRTPSARIPKTRTKTQSAKPKQRKNRTLRKKHK